MTYKYKYEIGDIVWVKEAFYWPRKGSYSFYTGPVSIVSCGLSGKYDHDIRGIVYVVRLPVGVYEGLSIIGESQIKGLINENL
jgi:hypothetical protein